MADTKGAITAGFPVKFVDLLDGSFAIATTATIGDITVPLSKSATSVLTSVASANTTQVLLALNAGRNGAVFYNDSTAILYIAFAATASTSAYTVQVPSQGYFELPTTSVYTGVISGIWASANGNCRITELTT